MPNCSKCGKEFRDNGLLRRHLAAKKPCDLEPVDSVPCGHCDKLFKTEWHVKRHVEAVHKPVAEAKTKSDSNTKQTSMTVTVEGNSGVMNFNGGVTVHNHITISAPVEFGHENVNDLIDADWSKLGGVTHKREIVTALIKYLNCNEERPQGHNVLVLNSDAEDAFVYQQRNWRQRNCEEAVRDCISNVSLKAQDALLDTEFQKMNPTPKARIDACLKTLEEIAEQADKADTTVTEDVERAKQAIVNFTSKHPELIEFAQVSAQRATALKKYRESKVFKGYGPGGSRREELLRALQNGDEIPDLCLERLP